MSSNNNTVFNQNPVNYMYNTEVGMANDNYESLLAMSNTLPKQRYNQKILQNNFNDNILTPDEPDQIISPLTGQKLGNKQDFLSSTGFNKLNGETYINTMNNLPYNKGNTKQNMDPYVHESLLENYTGISKVKRNKKEEVSSFYDIVKDSGKYTTGTPADKLYNGFEDRIYRSQLRQGEKPFQEIRVGPGLGSGYNSEPEGGFHQQKMYDIARAKAERNVNNRLPNNPKVSYTLPVKPGALPGGTRGLQAAVVSHRPPRWYKNSPDRYFVTGGAVKASRLLPRVIAKSTNRQSTTKEHFGGIGGLFKGQMKDKLHRKSRRQNFKNPYMRNLHQKGKWKINNEGFVGDYGLKSIENKPNERDITTERTHQLNLTTTVKKLITPLTDILRTTKKEQMIDNSHMGYMKGPQKLQIHDPNDVMRTTKKEQLINNNHMGSIKGPEKLQIHDPNDVMRTTKKEQLIDNNHMGSIKGPEKLQVHDPNDVMRTTKKEQNIDNFHMGSIKGPEKHVIQDPNDIPRTTIKEQTIHNNHIYLNLSPQHPKHLRIYDPEDIARTTRRELTENNNHNGFIQGIDDTKPGGYISTSVTAKNTHKQFLSDYYYVGNANSDMTRGGGRGYTTRRMDARATNRQYTTDYEYSGIAGGAYKAQTSYADKECMRTNPNKEKLVQGRDPTQTSVKVKAGGDMINLTPKKLDGDYVNTREPSETMVYQAPPTLNNCSLTHMKDKLPEDTLRQRIDDDLLSAFRENPYTHSLQSAV